MSKSNTNAEQFDVFLCHNSEDKPAIRDFARKLEEHGVKPWLDEEQIRPGTSWQTALGEQIEHIKSAAVFVGESGFGPWQSQEIQALLSQFVNRKCPVIPVVLPTAEETPDLPWTLQNIHWVDFRADHPDPMCQLIWGITGEKPGDTPQKTQPLASDIPIEAAELFPPQKKKIIEVRLPGNLDDFSDEEQRKLIQSLTSMMKIGDVKLTRAVAGSVRLYLELDPEDADKLHSAKQEGLLANLGIQEVRLYPALPEPPEDEQRSQLMILLDRVKEYWIDGALKNSLYYEVLISLGKRAVDEAVEPPSKHYTKFTEQRRFLNLEDRGISTVFDANGLLLILGEPGSGKTTTMLDLASGLITRAKADARERVPIVLNLSSWKKQLSLDEWIAEELSAKYRVPKKIGRRWLKNGYILPLLDGLDEVKTAEQPNCVAVINKYIDQFDPSGIVVCCRLMEYQWLPERLKLNGAICLELLGSKEVDEFLTSGGQQLAGLRQAMKTDPVLQELSQTPLMLSIMSLAFEGEGGDALAKRKAGSTKERRDQIFNLYIDRMFQRKDKSGQPFPKAKVLSWLVWLARGMKEHSQSVLMVEELQPSWLVNKLPRFEYSTFAVCVLSLIWIASTGFVSILFGLYGGKLGFQLAVLIAILLGVSIKWSMPHSYSLMVIQTVEFVRYKQESMFAWMTDEKKSNRNNAIGITVGIIVGFMKGWILGLCYWIITAGLITFGLMLLDYMQYAEIVEFKKEKASPNQGIINSMKSAFYSLYFYGLYIGVFGVFWGLFISLLIFNAKDTLFFTLTLGIFLGLTSGIAFWFLHGGSAFLKHYILRLIFWINGYTPFNFIKFLDYSAKLILLKKVGGGYMFIHRMLLEHFAEMNTSDSGQKETID